MAIAGQFGGSVTPFAIIGGGWRTGFYLRVARELPDRFRVTGLLARDPARRDRLGSMHAVPVVATLAELLEPRPSFVVVATRRCDEGQYRQGGERRQEAQDPQGLHQTFRASALPNRPCGSSSTQAISSP